MEVMESLDKEVKKLYNDLEKEMGDYDELGQGVIVDCLNYIVGNQKQSLKYGEIVMLYLESQP